MLGLSANLIDLFGSVEDIDDDLKKLQIVGDTYDEKRDELAKVWGDEIHIIDDCKSVYDAIILMSIKEPGLTISQSKVKAFDKHKDDLVILKSLLKLDRNVYNEMFKSDKKGYIIMYTILNKVIQKKLVVVVKIFTNILRK